jgi:hypothetical protein
MSAAARSVLAGLPAVMQSRWMSARQTEIVPAIPNTVPPFPALLFAATPRRRRPVDAA